MYRENLSQSWEVSKICSWNEFVQSDIELPTFPRLFNFIGTNSFFGKNYAFTQAFREYLDEGNLNQTDETNEWTNKLISK